MTLVGHSFVSAAIGAACIPVTLPRKKQLTLFGIFIFIGMIPDLPLPGWGHYRYHVSHSLFVNLALMGGAVVWLITRQAPAAMGGVRVLVGGGLVWLSHFLLDSFYRHGLGVGIFWPFSDRHLALPLPWFDILRVSEPLSWHNLSVVAVELAVYLPLFLAALFLRRVSASNRHPPAEYP